jgi:membrane-bound inhibitor of C-type lysozyme
MRYKSSLYTAALGGFLAVLFFLLISGACAVILQRQSQLQSASVGGNQALVGNDRDSHGCIGSAGYSWCELKQTCLRPWEEYCTAAIPKTALFTCDDNKSITATFYPTDDKYVDLSLSDGRKFSVPHAVSADGARYANADESFVFWNKGDTAFITEDGATVFANCVTGTLGQ